MNIQDIYSTYVETQAAANERNKATVIEALIAVSITRVVLTFDGAGDSGQIESVTAFRGDAKAEIPSTVISFEEVTWGRSVSCASRDIPLPNAVEDLCYGYLSQMYGGWENNDGAFGEFLIDVANRNIEFEFNGRYTEYSTETHTL